MWCCYVFLKVDLHHTELKTKEEGVRSSKAKGCQANTITEIHEYVPFLRFKSLQFRMVVKWVTWVRVNQNGDGMRDSAQSDSDWWQNEGLGSEWSHQRAAEPRVSKVPIIQLQRGEIRAQRRFCPTISQPLHTLQIKYSQTAGNQANTNIGGLKHQVQSIWKHLCKVTETPFYFWLILSRSIQNVRVNKLEQGQPVAYWLGYMRVLKQGP